jgi:hypothetical protein
MLPYQPTAHHQSTGLSTTRSSSLLIDYPHNNRLASQRNGKGEYSEDDNRIAASAPQQQTKNDDIPRDYN